MKRLTKSTAGVAICAATALSLAGCGEESSTSAAETMAEPDSGTDSGTDSGPDPDPSAESCMAAIIEGLDTCSVAASTHFADCYALGATDCTTPPFAASLNSALSMLATDVDAVCSDAILSGLGFDVDLAGLQQELRGQCVGPSATLVARAFGGPTAQVLRRASVVASPEDTACLTTAHDVAASFLSDARSAYQQCIEGGTCSTVEGDIAALQAAAATMIDDGCDATSLSELVGVTPAILLERTTADAHCQIAVTQPDVSQLSLECAPMRTVPATQAWSYPGGTPTELFPSRATSDGTPSPTVQHAPQRGEFVQIELDGSSTGAVCGDGSNYRFWVQLAPTGFDIDNVLISVQGGGSCAGTQCTNEILGAIEHASMGDGSSNLINTRMDDNGDRGQAEGSMTRLTTTRSSESPYQNWTKIMLPYCTQDLHGGGRAGTEDVVVTVPGEGDRTYTIRRTGGHNLQTALRVARNVIWAAMNEEGQAYEESTFEGTMSGVSAGGYGAAVHYHFVLDELRWTNTKALNMIGFSMDDSASSSTNLRALFNAGYASWGSGSVFPPYCQDDACAFAETLGMRSLQRMDTTAYPRQHYSFVSAQVDQNLSTSSESAAGLSRQEVWGNAMRATFCRMRDPANNPSQVNLHFFLPLIVAHPISAGQAFPPNNIDWLDWVSDFEVDLMVDDNVDASSNEVGGNTLDPFGCTP